MFLIRRIFAGFRQGTKVPVSWFAVFFIAFSVLFFSAPRLLHAAEPVQVSASTENGYGRLVFSFKKMPVFKAQIKSGVLVLSFNKPIEASLEKVNVRLPEYVLIARLDPDGKAIRFALAQKIRVNTIKAGEKLFVDLLPSDWSGLPPGLPPETVAELAALAAQAEEARKRAEALRKANAKAPRLILHIGRMPTFSRLVFDWNVPVATSMTRKKNIISLEFDQLAAIDLTRLNSNPPRFVRSAKNIPVGRGTRVDVTIDETANVRGFREGIDYVLDVTGEPEVEEPDPIVKIRENQRDPLFPKVPMGAEVVYALGEPSDKPPRKKSVPKEQNAPPAVEKPVAEKPAATEPEPQKPPQVEDKKTKAAAAREKPAAGSDAPPEIKIVKARSARPLAVKQEAMVPVKAERIGSSVKLTFKFSKEVPSAIFLRSGVLWTVFDSDKKLDLGKIAQVLKDKVDDIELSSNARVQIARFLLKDKQLVSTAREASSWIVIIGDILLNPAKPLLLKRGLREDGYSKITVKLPFAGHVHWLEDAGLDERLAVVTAHAPARGMIKKQEFVEFAALKTANGIVVRPYADDLSVRLNHDELVISRPLGLTISSGGARQYEAGRKAVREGSEPGFLDLAKWSDLGPRQFNARLDDLTLLSGDDDKDKRVQARLEMARLYLGRMWGVEALANLDIALETDPGLKGDPVFNAMRGVAAILANRLDIANKNLRVHALAGDMDAKLWRGLMAVKRQKWDDAWRFFNEAVTAIPKYPFHVQMEFRLAAMEASIETGDVTSAGAELDAMPAGLKGDLAVRTEYLKGRLYEALGRTEEAYEAYLNASRSNLRKTEVAARYHLTDLKLRNDKISMIEAIEELESLAFMWRGDDTELKVLHLLGTLYRKSNAYRRALETMKMAVKSFSDRPESRVIQSEMEGLFKELFLRNMAEKMEPLKALSLFYDYAALTPPGRLGDDMIRKLADRLVSVDLLPQAEEILEHQVSTRLHGAARAQVAAKLAYIYLLDRKPEQALRVIRQSQQSVMPKSITRRRDILESRALAELGQVEQAMELLSVMKGEDVERLKAEALWTGRNWQSAGEQIERILDPVWKSDRALTDKERLDVLRAGISFALADDRLGLDRLREKFIDKMAKSPDAAAFSLVTETTKTSGVAFSDLARKIASLDTLSAFLKDYRKRYVEKGEANAPKS